MDKGPKKKTTNKCSKMLNCTLRNVSNTSFSLTLWAKINQLSVSTVDASVSHRCAPFWSWGYKSTQP